MRAAKGVNVTRLLIDFCLRSDRSRHEHSDVYQLMLLLLLNTNRIKMTSGPAQVFIGEPLISRVRTADVFHVNGNGLMCTSQETKEVPPYRTEL